VTHIKKRTKDGVREEVEDESPLKEDSEDSKMEEAESPEKTEENSEIEADTAFGCFIGIWCLDGLWNIVKTNAQRMYQLEDTVSQFKFIVPKALSVSPVLTLTKVKC